MCSKLSAASFPSPPERDPEREEDQPDVEGEGLALDVKPVVPELVATDHIARRVDLRNAGQAWTHGASRRESGYILQPLDAAAAVHFDLPRPQRARPYKTHVAAEDVPQLRQLVH